jgi:hypothetical protein
MTPTLPKSARFPRCNVHTLPKSYRTPYRQRSNPLATHCFKQKNAAIRQNNRRHSQADFGAPPENPAVLEQRLRRGLAQPTKNPVAGQRDFLL